MLVKTSGFATLVKKEVPQVSVTHWFLHGYALASNILPENLRQVLSSSVKITNQAVLKTRSNRLEFRSC